MRAKLALLLAMGLVTPMLGGCVVAALGAAAGGGYVVADESKEKDGKFDPLEDARGKSDGKN